VESLQLGTPVLAWAGGTDRNHVALLEPLDGLYEDPVQLWSKLKSKISGLPTARNRAILEMGNKFRPEQIIPKFNQVMTDLVERYP